MPDEPVAYFITFRTYGTWLPGDERGFTDRQHKGWNEPHAAADSQRANIAFSRLTIPPVTLTGPQRHAVAETISDQCRHRSWHLHALNVRTQHVHLVVSASGPPERVLNMLKAYATRALRRAGLWSKPRGPWSRHGSTVYVWSEESLREVCRYVVHRQGRGDATETEAPLPPGRGTDDRP